MKTEVFFLTFKNDKKSCLNHFFMCQTNSALANTGHLRPKTKASLGGAALEIRRHREADLSGVEGLNRGGEEAGSVCCGFGCWFLMFLFLYISIFESKTSEL